MQNPVKECNDFEERSAIMEFDGNLTREEAEALAREIHPEIKNERLLPDSRQIS